MTTFVPASTLAPAERVALFNAGYADYVIPFQVDEQRLLFMERAYGHDLDASLVAVVGEHLELRSEDAGARVERRSGSDRARVREQRAQERPEVLFARDAPWRLGDHRPLGPGGHSTNMTRPGETVTSRDEILTLVSSTS